MPKRSRNEAVCIKAARLKKRERDLFPADDHRPGSDHKKVIKDEELKNVNINI